MPRVIGIHYTLRDDLGEQIDSSRGGDPLYFLEGSGQIIPGLERELIGMQAGDKREVEVKASEAYGDMNPELVATVKRSQFPPGAPVDVGEQFTVERDGPVFTIVEVEGDDVTVDANHPMAGKDLHFDVEIVEMREATPDEMKHGHAHGPRGHAH